MAKMKNSFHFTKRWVLVGATCGMIACIIYPALIFISLPKIVGVLLAAALGPLISISSIGLYHLIRIQKKSVSLQIATLFNIIAGLVINLMLMVQLAVREYMNNYLNEATNEYAREQILWIWKGVDKVQLGLDVSWDVFLATGTFLFSLNMLKHPRFGKIFGGVGVVLALLLLGFNFFTFPVPPAEAGLIDFGPMVGLWYLVVAYQSLRSLDWVEKNVTLEM